MLKNIVRNRNSNSLLHIFKTLRGNDRQALVNKFRTKASWPFNFGKMSRTWESVKQNGAQTVANTNVYKLLSYNILAQDLLVEHLHLYIKIDPALLRWDQRLGALRDEILHINPDILCLQEMQFNHLKEFVKQISKKRELEYIFKKKTGYRTDGCAIIYDRKKFHLIEEQHVEYFVPGHPILNRENVALLAKFKAKTDPGNTFVVATTHLLYNPRRQDVREAQVMKLLTALQQFSTVINNKKMELVPVILTGDFNFEPRTTPYNMFFQVFTSPPKQSTQKMDCPDKNDAANVNKFVDRYESLNGLQMFPLQFGLNTASTFQDEWITVDYILHSIGDNRKKIKVWTAYHLPTIKECTRIGNIPNQQIGSDHYCLGITFSLL